MAILIAACANGINNGDVPKNLNFEEAIAKLPSPASLDPLGIASAGKTIITFDPSTEPMATTPAFVDAFANGGFESISAVVFNELRQKMLSLTDADLMGAVIDLGQSTTTGKNFYCTCSKVDSTIAPSRRRHLTA